MLDLRTGAGEMIPAQLRKLADMIEKGDAHASFETEIIDNHRPETVGSNSDGWPFKRYKDKRINIEVTVMGEFMIQYPNGEWVIVR